MDAAAEAKFFLLHFALCFRRWLFAPDAGALAIFFLGRRVSSVLETCGYRCSLHRWAHSLQLGAVLARRAQRPLGDLHVFATRKLELVLRAVHSLHDTTGPV